MAAIRREASKKPNSIRLFRDRARKAAPSLAGAVAVGLMIVWLWPEKTAKNESARPPTLPILQIEEIAQYKSELAKMQADVSRSAIFVRAASQPMKILDRE